MTTLLELPREVLQIIYKKVLQDARVEFGKNSEWIPGTNYNLHAYCDFRALRICRQIYNEALPNLYASLTVVFEYDATPTDLQRFIKRNYLQQIQYIEIRYVLYIMIELNDFAALRSSRYTETVTSTTRIR